MTAGDRFIKKISDYYDDLGYPASLEIEPGELLTVYYQIDKLGEKTSLMATRWSIE